MIKEIKQQEMYKIIILRIIRIFLVISHNFFFFFLSKYHVIRTYLYRIVIPQTRRNVTYPFSLGKHDFSVART